MDRRTRVESPGGPGAGQDNDENEEPVSAVSLLFNEDSEIHPSDLNFIENGGIPIAGAFAYPTILAAVEGEVEACNLEQMTFIMKATRILIEYFPKRPFKLKPELAMRFVRAATLSLVLIGLVAFGSLVCFQAISCPLCEGVGNTISDDVKSPAVGAIAVCQRCTEIADGQFELEIDPKSVVPVGRGPNEPTPKIERLLIFEAVPPKTSVFLIGIPDDCERDHPGVAEKKSTSWIWTAPLAVSTLGREYLQGLPTEATPEVQRLIYFYSHLSSTDSFVNEDAYNECARVSLSVMRDPVFQKTISRESLVGALRGSAMNPKHKSFLWMVLAEWGKESDQELFRELVTPILKRQLESVGDERVSVDLAKDHPWMAASIAAFIKLGKEPALREIEEFIFANPKCSMSMKSTGINAARVLGNDLRAMETQRLARSLAMMIQDTECADLVIPDLARWDYWDAMPELVRLFDRPESARGFVRTPIMNYLRRCPLPQADQHLKRMRAEDPAAYRRALTNVPVLEKAPVLTP